MLDQLLLRIYYRATYLESLFSNLVSYFYNFYLHHSHFYIYILIP
jgi:hypothetical protein